MKLKSTSNFICTFPKIIFHWYITFPVDRDSKFSIATCYGLEGQGIESWWGGKFSTDQSWGPPSLQSNVYQVSFLGVKQLWRGIDHLPLSLIEVKERVDL